MLASDKKDEYDREASIGEEYQETEEILQKLKDANESAAAPGEEPNKKKYKY